MKSYHHRCLAVLLQLFICLQSWTAHALTTNIAAQPLLDPAVTSNYSNSNTIGNFASMGTHTYFITGDNTGGTQNVKLWVTDGGSGNTSLVKDTGAVGFIGGLFSTGSKVYFVADTTLWMSDGTTGGTVVVPGTYANPQNLMAVIGSDLYFTAQVTSGGAYQIHKHTGSGNATAVTSIAHGSTFTQGSLTVINGFLFFTSPITATQTQLFRYNPSGGATTQLTSFGGLSGANISAVAGFGTSVFFVAVDPVDLGSHWYRIESDGTGLVNLSPNGFGASGSNNIAKIGSTYYFVLSDSGTLGNQLYKSNGTTANGATLYTNQDGLHNGNFIFGFTSIDTKIYASTDFGPTSVEREMGVIDTTDLTGTVTVLKDANPGANNGTPTNFVVIGSKLFFSATIATGDTAQFQSDGTPGGTFQVPDTVIGATDAPSGGTAVGNLLYLRAKTSGSPATTGTQRLPMNLVTVTAAQGDGQTAAINTAYATALQVQVKDSLGVNNLAGVSVTFSPPVSGAGGSFASSATVTTNASGIATAPAFTANGTNGPFVVKVLLSGIDSGVSFALTNGASPGVAVTSLNRNNTTPSNASFLNWTLTFASPVTGLTASNFTLSGAAAAGSTVISPGTSNAGLTWTIPVNTGSTDGTLTLNLANSTGLSSAISTVLPFAGESYTMDKTPPTVLSVVRQSPTGQNTNATTVTFRVTYSEPVNLTPPLTTHYQVVPVGGSTIVGNVTGVTGADGTATRDVTVQLTSGTGEFKLRVLD